MPMIIGRYGSDDPSIKCVEFNVPPLFPPKNASNLMLDRQTQTNCRGGVCAASVVYDT